MSEDIDLRIVTEDPNVSLGEGARRRFRQAVSQALTEAGFTFDPENPEQLKSYDAGSLRSGVKVEISSWPLQLPPVQKDVSSFVAAALK